MTLFSTSVRLLYNVADFAWMSYRYWNGAVCPWSWLMHKWVKFKWLEKKKILSDCVRVLVKHLMKHPLLTHSFPMHPQKQWEIFRVFFLRLCYWLWLEIKLTYVRCSFIFRKQIIIIIIIIIIVIIIIIRIQILVKALFRVVAPSEHV